MWGDPRYFTGRGNPGCDCEQHRDNFHNVGSYYATNNGLPEPNCDDYRAEPNNGFSNGMFNDIELQASENCPKNFVIFDQTNNTSRIMFNPSHGFNIPTSQSQRSKKIPEINDQFIPSASVKEDSEEIDALLSLDEDSDRGEEDDVISTGRTPDGYYCSSPDSTCSTAASRRGKQKCLYSQNAGAGGPISERKRARMKKMVKVLRGIVPGGQQMDTPAFLDEAVKYLKSLKMEVKKLGIQTSKN